MPAILISWIVAAAAVSADPAPRPPFVFVDFENLQATRLEPGQAKAALTTSGNNHVLEIATEAQAAYPGVGITPREGKWDLTGYDGVEMDVSNPQDVPVRVLLAVNNPGADGRKNCNTESVSVGPGKRAVLTVPFGSWHGESGHPIDQANIVSVRVMLDRPGRPHRFLVDNIRAVKLAPASLEQVMADPFFKQLEPTLGRGVNLGNALDAPKEGEWGVTLKEEYFNLIKQAGFDSVRLPVRWSAHAEAAAPYRIDPAFLARVDWAVEQALSQKLSVVLNVHHYEELMKQPAGHRQRFLALWDQLAQHYRDRPAALVFELLNEPAGNLTADAWNDLAAEGIAVVRRTNPMRSIVVGPVHWNSISELKSLELPESDRNLIVTVHYYSPFQFTHQGASWAGKQAQDWLGTRWTGTQAEQQAVTQDLDKAIAWAVEHRRPIYLGEFGAYNKADLESRARWTRFVAEEAAKRKMSYAYWEFCSGFGAYNQGAREWITPLRDALVPK